MMRIARTGTNPRPVVHLLGQKPGRQEPTDPIPDLASDLAVEVLSEETPSQR